MGYSRCRRNILNWYKQQKFSQEIEYRPFDYMGTYLDIDQDRNEELRTMDVQQESENVFQQSGIRLNRDKEITQIAEADGLVVGALATNWYETEEYGFPVRVFDVDVAVRPDYRGPQLIGLNLIKRAIQQYEDEKYIWEEMGLKTMMKSWVINPRLIDILERRYGFEIESEGGQGDKRWAYLIRY